MGVWDGYNEAEDQTANNWGQKTDVGEGLNPADAMIDKNADGTDAFASAYGKGWHNLGVVLNKAATAEELLLAAQGDYPVFLSKVYTMDDFGQAIEDPHHRMICRGYQDEPARISPLGISSPRYTPIDNRTAFVDIGDEVLDLAEPNAATCGILYGGRQAFMSWRLPKEITVAGADDKVQLWMTFCHSHDQSLPFIAMVNPLRTVCVNTMRYNMFNNVSKWTIKKTANAKIKLGQVKESLKLTYAYADEWQTTMRELATARLTTHQFLDLVTRQFGPGEDAAPNQEAMWDEKLSHLVNGYTIEAARFGRNAWSALNAVDSYYQHIAKVDTAVAKKHGFKNAEAVRMWRTVTNEKSVTNPREGFFKRLVELTGVSA